jgi:hypothetical protein
MNPRFEFSHLYHGLHSVKIFGESLTSRIPLCIWIMSSLESKAPGALCVLVYLLFFGSTFSGYNVAVPHCPFEIKSSSCRFSLSWPRQFGLNLLKDALIFMLCTCWVDGNQYCPALPIVVLSIAQIKQPLAIKLCSDYLRLLI